MRKEILILCLVVVGGCASFARQPFDVHEGAIRYTNLAGGRYRVTGADVKTFQHVGDIYGKDVARVYHAYTVVEGADPLSFQYIGGDAGRDAKAVYVAGTRCPDCDVPSFRHVDRSWYADKDFIYEGTRRRPDIDQKTFHPLNYWFAKDRNNVFLSGRPIPGANAESFRLASWGCESCGEDRNRCYWFDHPVPCDGAKHSGSEFPQFMADVPERKVVISGHALSINAGLPKDSRTSAGRRIVSPGKYNLTIDCWSVMDRKSIPVEMSVDLKPGIYRLDRVEIKKCEYRMSRPALVLGKKDRPEVQLRKMGDEIRGELELEPGKHSFTAICREVQRAGVRQSSTEITLDLTPGDIYQLDADFKAPENKCDVRSTKR